MFRKIYILSQYFYPDIAATAQLLTELAEDLVKYGLEVKVLTTNPSYYKYKKSFKIENYNGITIKRVWSTHFNKKSFVGRILNEISFTFMILIEIFIGIKEKGIFLIVTNPSILPFLGIILKKLKKSPFVLIIHDVYPDIIVKLGILKKNSIFIKFFEYINKKSLIYADRIIVLGEIMRDVIANKLNNIYKNISKIEIIHNWADEKQIVPICKKDNWFIKKYNLENKFIVIYSGNLGLSHPLENIVEVAKQMKDKNILFLFIGDGEKKNILEKLTENYNLNNVRFMPYQKYKDISYSLSAADIAIVTMEKNIEGLSVPSKLYSYLAVGKPIIGIVSEKSEVAYIIKNANCGYIVKQDDLDGLYYTINFLYTNPNKIKELSENARNYFEKNFTRTLATKKYLNIITSVK